MRDVTKQMKIIRFPYVIETENQEKMNAMNKHDKPKPNIFWLRALKRLHQRTKMSKRRLDRHVRTSLLSL